LQSGNEFAGANALALSEENIMTAALGRFDLLQAEQEAFDRHLEEMLHEHAGEFVLFRHGKPVKFFPDYQSAYKAGLAEFGLDQVFLVSEVKRRHAEPVSLSWTAGVMFGQA
jgi:hypothetical protein